MPVPIRRSSVTLLSRPVAIGQLQPIGRGSQRYVFVHPDDPGMIVKVPHEQYVARRSGVYSWRWYKKYWRRRLRTRHFIVFFREVKEHLAVRAAGPAIPPHMQTIIGFVETDLGMGLVCHCIRTDNGALAPTLRTIVQENRFDQQVERDLDAFFAWLLGSPIVVSDINSRNLVYGHNPQHGNLFVLIDGIGEKNLVPLSSMSPWLNKKAKQRRIQRLRAEIETLRHQALASGPSLQPLP